MGATLTDVRLHRELLALLLPGALLVGGLVFYFHAPILTLLGWAGGFRFVEKIGPVYVAVGGVLLLVGVWSRDRLDLPTASVAAAASLPALFAIVVTQPSEPIFAPIHRVLLYAPVALALPLGVATATSRRRAVYGLVGASAVCWMTLAVLVVASGPRGPVGVYLVWNSVFAVVLGIPVAGVGWIRGWPGPET